jgi:hypothetical protein
MRGRLHAHHQQLVFLPFLLVWDKDIKELAIDGSPRK